MQVASAGGRGRSKESEPEGIGRQNEKESPSARAQEGKNGDGGVVCTEGRRKIFLMSTDFQVLTQNGGCPFKFGLLSIIPATRFAIFLRSCHLSGYSVSHVRQLNDDV